MLHNSIQTDRVAGCQMMTHKYIVAMIVELADRLDRAARPSKRLRFLVGGMDKRAPIDKSGRTRADAGKLEMPPFKGFRQPDIEEIAVKFAPPNLASLNQSRKDVLLKRTREFLDQVENLRRST